MLRPPPATKRHSPMPLTHEHRRVYVGDYAMLSWIDEPNCQVTVARVVYARRDLASCTGRFCWAARYALPLPLCAAYVRCSLCVATMCCCYAQPMCYAPPIVRCSLFVVRCSLFTVHCLLVTGHCGVDRPNVCPVLIGIGWFGRMAAPLLVPSS